MAEINDQRDAKDSTVAKGPADAASMAALFVIILAVSIALALWTDLNIVVRGGIAIGSGLIAALVTFLLVSRLR